MVLGCGAKVLKYCLFAFNLVFFVAGVVCLGIGIYIIVDKHAFDKIIEQMKVENVPPGDRPPAVYDLGVVMSIGGAIILVIAFLGCCGAVKEWRPLLILYAICLMIILAIEIGIAIYAAVERNSLETQAKNVLVNSLKIYAGTEKNASLGRVSWDEIMKKADCCGVNSTSNEFTISKWFANFSATYDKAGHDNKGINASFYYPAACCASDTDLLSDPVGPDDRVCPTDKRRPLGCFQSMKDNIGNKLAIVIGVGAGVGLIQLIGILFSICLCRAIGDEAIG